MITLVGLLVFGLTWMTYRRVYQAFGLAPNEIGLDYVTVLSRATSGLAVLALIMLASWLVWRLLGPDITRQGLLWRGTLAVVAQWSAGLVVIWLLAMARLPVGYLAGFAFLAVVLVSMIISARCGMKFALPVTVSDGLKKTLRAVWGFLLVTAGLGNLVFLFFMPNWIGDDLSSRMHFDELGISDTDYPRLVDVKTVDVKVAWPDGELPFGLGENPDCREGPSFKLLGTVGDLLILNSRPCNTTLMVNSQNVTLSTTLGRY